MVGNDHTDRLIGLWRSTLSERGGNNDDFYYFYLGLYPSMLLNPGWAN